MFFEGGFDSCRGSTAAIAAAKGDPAMNIKSLSAFTQAENTFVLDKISRLKERDARERDRIAPSNLSTVNCEELLRKANQEIKRVNYNLSRVVSSGEYH